MDAPWHTWDTDIVSWLALGPVYNIYLTVADFLCLLLLSYLYKTDVKTNNHHHHSDKTNQRSTSMTSELTVDSSDEETIKKEEKIPILRHIKQPNRKDSAVSMADFSSEEKQKIAQKSKLRISENDLDDVSDEFAVGDASDVEMENKKEEIELDSGSIHLNSFSLASWRGKIMYSLCRYSYYLLLFLIFMSATSIANLVNSGYILFVLYCYYKDSELFQRKNEIWKWGRVYNFLVMMLILFFQFPYFPACTPNQDDDDQGSTSCEDYSIQSIIGLYKFTDTKSVFTEEGILYHVIIFLLMTLQSFIFTTEVFATVASYIAKDDQISVYRAKREHLSFLRRERRAMLTLADETQRRKERLEKINQYRSEKQYLVAQTETVVLEGDSKPILGVPTDLESSDANNQKHPNERNIISSSFDFISDLDQEEKTKLERLFNINDEAFVLLENEEILESEIEKLTDEVEKYNDTTTTTTNKKTEDEINDNDSITSAELLTTKEKLNQYKEKIIQLCNSVLLWCYNTFIMILFSSISKKPKKEHTKKQTILRGLYFYFLYHSQFICYITFILDGVLYGNLLSYIYIFLTFIIALLESYPSRSFWKFCILYTTIVISLKFIFQISVFCVCYSTIEWYFWCIEPFCNSSSSDPFCSPSFQNENIVLRNLPEFFGITKIQGFFVWYIALDILVLAALLLHRNILKKNGLWIYSHDAEQSSFSRFLNFLQLKNEKKQKKAEKLKEKLRKIKEYHENKRLEKKNKKLNKTNHDDSLESSNKSGEQLGDHNELVQEHTSQMILDSNEKYEQTESQAQPFPDGDEDDNLIQLADIEQVVEEDEKSGEEDSEYSVTTDEEVIPNDNDNDDDNDNQKAKSSKIQKIKFYYFSLLKHKLTANDYYVPMVSVECLAFFYIVLCQNGFSYNAPSEYSFILLESRIPTSFFFILLLQFCFIVIDRVIYLFRSILCKIIMQYFTMIYYLLVLFFYLPSGHEEPFHSSWVLIVFFILKCIYWWISALQISDGYPPNIQTRYITSSYGKFHQILFSIYLFIPFLFELRSLLDWSVFDTTLNFNQWMKLEDIYRNLYQIKCEEIADSSAPPEAEYEKKSFFSKNLLGFIVFIGLILIIWFPLFLLSAANPTNQPNLVVSCKFEISVSGTSPFYLVTQDQDLNVATSSQFDTIRNNFPSVQGGDAGDTQVVSMNMV